MKRHVLRPGLFAAGVFAAGLTVAGAPVLASPSGVAEPLPSPTPEVQNLVATPLTPYSASLSADVVSGGGEAVDQRGFVYSWWDPDPLPGGGFPTQTVPGGIGPMSASLWIDPGYTYWVRAWARNTSGLYGFTDVASFMAPCPVVSMGDIPSRAAVGAYYYSTVPINGPHNFWLSGGTPPPGLTVGYYGEVYGYPTQTGVFTFTITAGHAWYPCQVSREYTITVGSLTVSPSALKFASEVVSQQSPAQSVTIGNYGSDDITLQPFTIDAPFSVVSTDCSGVLSAGTYCTANIAMTPTDQVSYTGALTIQHDHPFSPDVVSLRGAGTSAPVGQVYVANDGRSEVVVIDPVTNFVRTSVPVGSGPQRPTILPGGAKVYVPARWSDAVTVIDTTNYATNSITGIYEPISSAASPTGNEVFVLRSSSNISVIDTATDTVVAEIDAGDCAEDPTEILANHKNQDLYVFSPGNNRVCVYNRTGRAFDRAYTVSNYPYDGIVSSDGASLFILREAGTTARLNLSTGAVTGVPGVDAHEVDISADGTKLYVSTPGTEVTPAKFGVVDTNSLAFSPITLPDGAVPAGVAVHPAAGRAYLVDETNLVRVIDLSSGTEVVSPDTPIKDDLLYSLFDIAAPRTAPIVGTAPSVSGMAAVGQFVSADASANVTDGGSEPVLSRGFVYSATNADPKIGGVDVGATAAGSGVGPMSATLIGLGSGQTYFARAYAQNVIGIGYSEVVSFSTSACGELTFSESSGSGLGRVGEPFSLGFTAGGGVGPYGLTFDGLPAGLSISGMTVTGTPTLAGTGTFSATATDLSTGCFVSMDVSIEIASVVLPRNLVISEFRSRGPGGDEDDYIEIANRTGADIVVRAADGSGGFGIGQAGALVTTIPDGTVIPKGGHWLAAANGYSLSDYGVPNPYVDNEMTALADDAGIALFSTASPAAFDGTTVLDAVGSSDEPNPLYREQGGLPPLGSGAVSAQIAWVRRMLDSGSASDVDDNARDFILVSNQAYAMYGPTSEVAAVFGAPNPEGTWSVRDVKNEEFPVSLVEPLINANRYPNRAVDPGNYGSISFRRIFTNLTGKTIRTLAFKATTLTTAGSRRTLSAQSDMRLASSGDAQFDTSIGSIFAQGSALYNPWVGAALHDYDGSLYDVLGGVNDLVVVIPPGGGEGGGEEEAKVKVGGCGLDEVLPGEKVAVNLRLRTTPQRGYYLFTVMPQISEDTPWLERQRTVRQARGGGCGGGAD